MLGKFLVGLIIIISGASLTHGDMPMALQMAEESRKSLAGADIRWKSIEFNKDPTDRRNNWAGTSETVERLHRSRYALNGDMSYTDRGDLSGVFQYDEDGVPQITSTRGGLIRQNGEVWSHLKGMLVAKHWKDQNVEEWRLRIGRFYDIRSLGLITQFPSNRFMGTDDVFGLIGTEITEEINEDGVHVLRAVQDEGPTWVWHINPNKGWNPEKVAIEYGEDNEVSVISKLSQSPNGTWFPKMCSFYVSGELQKVIEVESATFDDATLKQIKPNDIGIEAGTIIFVPTGEHIWDGQEIVTAEEWSAAVKSGIKKPGPSIEYAWKHGTEHLVRMEPVKKKLTLSEWEKYVANFIRHYRLDDEQQQKAWQVHGRCKEQAQNYLRKKADDIVRLDTQIASDAKNPQLLERRDNLRKPIDDIFENYLKPRLDSILTREQKKRGPI
jgi:hypothetical protein